MINKKSKIKTKIIFLLFFSISFLITFNLVNAVLITETTSAKSVLSPSIALDTNGIAHVSYINDTDDALVYCNNSIGSFVCNEIYDVDIASGYAHTSIAMDSSNKVHIIYTSQNSYASYCNNTGGSWSCRGIEADLKYPSIAIDENNKVHIAGNDITHNDIKRCDNTNGSWSCNYLPTDTVDGEYPSIVANSTSEAIISKENGGNNRFTIYQYRVTAPSYTNVSSSLGTSGSGYYNSIARGSNAILHISTIVLANATYNGSIEYCNITPTYTYYIINSCTTVFTGKTLNRALKYSSIAVDNNDRVHITADYDDPVYGRGIEYCNNLLGSWNCSFFGDSGSNIGKSDRSLAIKKGRLIDSTSFSTFLQGVTPGLYPYYLNYFSTSYPSISIDKPKQQAYNTNNSIEINFSSLNIIPLGSCYYNIINESGSTIISNTSISNCKNTTFGLPSGDVDYTLNIYFNDSFGNLNYSNSSFAIRTNSPSISVNYPSSDMFINSNNIYFNFTAVRDIGIDTCELYGNWSGIWDINYTWINPTNNTMNYTSINVDDGVYITNVKCNDTVNNIGWALSNITFTSDTIFPVVSINSTLINADSNIVTFTSNETDTNINSCFYSVYNSVGLIDNSLSNISYTCNSGSHSFIVSDYGTYTLIAYARDSALNLNSTNTSFTTYASPASPGGGSGGGTYTVTNTTTKTFCGDLICQKPNEYGLYEDFYNCPIDCSGGDFNIDEFFNQLLPYCFDNNPSTTCLWSSLFQSFSAVPQENITNVEFTGKINYDTLVQNCFDKTKDKSECYWKTTQGNVAILVIILVLFFISFMKIPIEGQKTTIPRYISQKVKSKRKRRR